MEIKDLTAILVVATVGCILVAGFIPVVGESVSATTTFKNDGIYYMTNPTESMHVEFTGGTSWVIDGEPLVYTVLGATNVIVFDDTFIRNVGQVRGAITMTFESADLTINNGTITGTAYWGGADHDISWTYDTIYVAVPSVSEYIMTNPNNNTYILENSIMYGAGLTTVKDSDGNNQIIVCYVNVDGLTATAETPTPAVTISDIVVNATPVDGYLGLYKFTSVTFKATWGTYTTNCTYNIIIAPSEVTAEKATHADTNTASIVSMIPFILIMGIVLMFVGVVLVRRYV